MGVPLSDLVDPATIERLRAAASEEAPVDGTETKAERGSGPAGKTQRDKPVQRGQRGDGEVSRDGIGRFAREEDEGKEPAGDKPEPRSGGAEVDQELRDRHGQGGRRRTADGGIDRDGDGDSDPALGPDGFARIGSLDDVRRQIAGWNDNVPPAKRREQRERMLDRARELGASDEVLERIRRLPAPPPAATGRETRKDDMSDLEFKDEPAGTAIEHKADPGMGGAQVLESDPKTGRVVALVSVTGVEDRVKDIIEPGAYTKTLAEREPIGVWSHDDKTWVARTESAKELMPGDPFFRDIKTMDGKPWPAEAGGVLVEAQFNLATPHGAAAFSDVEFFKGKTGWSIGYRATKATRNVRTGVRSIKELDWYEFSPVMVGAASQPLTLSVKSLSADHAVDPNDGSGLFTEVYDELTADELGRLGELKASLGLEVKARVRTTAGAKHFGQPIGTVIIPDAVSGGGALSDADLAALDKEAEDADERAMIKKARALPPEKRREFLTAGNDGISGGSSGSAGSGSAPKQGDQVKVNGRDAEVVEVDGDKVTVVDHVTGKRRTVAPSDVSANPSGVYGGDNMEVNGKPYRVDGQGDLSGMSDDDLFDALTTVGRISGDKATDKDKRRFAVLSNERHRRAQTGEGRFGKLKGKTRELPVDGGAAPAAAKPAASATPAAKREQAWMDEIAKASPKEAAEIHERFDGLARMARNEGAPARAQAAQRVADAAKVKMGGGTGRKGPEAGAMRDVRDTNTTTDKVEGSLNATERAAYAKLTKDGQSTYRQARQGGADHDEAVKEARIGLRSPDQRQAARRRDANDALDKATRDAEMAKRQKEAARLQAAASDSPEDIVDNVEAAIDDLRGGRGRGGEESELQGLLDAFRKDQSKDNADELADFLSDIDLDSPAVMRALGGLEKFKPAAAAKRSGATPAEPVEATAPSMDNLHEMRDADLANEAALDPRYKRTSPAALDDEIRDAVLAGDYAKAEKLVDARLADLADNGDPTGNLAALSDELHRRAKDKQSGLSAPARPATAESRADRARDRARQQDAEADARVKDQQQLAALNRRRKAKGQPPLLRLPNSIKGLDLGEHTDDELELKVWDAALAGEDVEFADDDLEEKGSRASLNRSPKKNWVEMAGELPGYIREVARAVERETPGMTLDRAIPIAIGRIKKWARGGGGVKPDTVTKAAAAVAAWEALKAKSGKKFDSELLDELEHKGRAAVEAYETLLAAGLEVKVGEPADPAEPEVRTDAWDDESWGAGAGEPVEGSELFDDPGLLPEEKALPMDEVLDMLGRAGELKSAVVDEPVVEDFATLLARRQALEL